MSAALQLITMEPFKDELNAQAIEVSWNIFKKKQVNEAKDTFRLALDELRDIVDLNGKKIDHFGQVANKGEFMILEKVAEEGKTAVRIMDDTGDRTIFWSPDDPDQVKEASEIFNKRIAEGWKAYAVAKGGKKGKRIRKFDASREEIIFTEGTAMKLKDFAKSFRRTELLAKSYGG